MVYQSPNSSPALHHLASLDIAATVAGHSLHSIYSHTGVRLGWKLRLGDQKCHFRPRHLGFIYTTRREPEIRTSYFNPPHAYSGEGSKGRIYWFPTPCLCSAACEQRREGGRVDALLPGVGWETEHKHLHCKWPFGMSTCPRHGQELRIQDDRF